MGFEGCGWWRWVGVVRHCVRLSLNSCFFLCKNWRLFQASSIGVLGICGHVPGHDGR